MINAGKTNHSSLRAIFLALTLLSLLPFGLQAKNTYSDSDVSGTYYFTNIEVRWIPSYDSPNRMLNHCHVLGTAVSDGAGLVLTKSKNVCDITGTVEMDDTIHYQVNPDGQMTFYSEASGNTTHGQIIEAGRMILLDGSNNTNPSLILHYGTAVRLEKK